MNLVITTKSTSVPDAVCAFARTKDAFLLDEVTIMKFEMVPLGVSVYFQYERHGIKLTDLTPVTCSLQDFADVTQCKSKDDLAKTMIIRRLFDDGARQFNARNKHVEVDIAAALTAIHAIVTPDGPSTPAQPDPQK